MSYNTLHRLPDRVEVLRPHGIAVHLHSISRDEIDAKRDCEVVDDGGLDDPCNLFDVARDDVCRWVCGHRKAGGRLKVCDGAAKIAMGSADEGGNHSVGHGDVLRFCNFGETSRGGRRIKGLETKL